MAKKKISQLQSVQGQLSTSDKIIVNVVEDGEEITKTATLSQLPSYVDDIIEGYLYEEVFYQDAEHTIEITPEEGKIYVDMETNYTYRWSGSMYVQVGGEEQVQSDWNQYNDEAVDYVKNRPFYEDNIPDPSVETPIDIIPNIEGIKSEIFNRFESGYSYETYDPVYISDKSIFEAVNTSYLYALSESRSENLKSYSTQRDFKELGYLSFSSGSVLNINNVEIDESVSTPEIHSITPLTTISYDETNDCYGDISIWSYSYESGEVPSQAGICIKVQGSTTYVLVYGDIGLSQDCLTVSCEESQIYGATVNYINGVYLLGCDMSTLSTSSNISVTIGNDTYENVIIQKSDISDEYGEGAYGISIGNPSYMPDINTVFNFEPTEDSFGIIYYNIPNYETSGIRVVFEYEEIIDEDLFFNCSLDDAVIFDLKQIDAKFIPTIPMNYLNFKDSFFAGLDLSSAYSRFNIIHIQGSIEEIKQKYNASIDTDHWFRISTDVFPNNYQYDAFKKLLRIKKDTQCWIRFKIIDNDENEYEYEINNNSACKGMVLTPHPSMPQFLLANTSLYLDEETNDDVYLLMGAQSSYTDEINISDTCIQFNATISSDLTLPEVSDIKELYLDVDVAPDGKYFGGVPLCLIDGTDNYVADWDSLSNYLNFIKNKPFDVVVSEQMISSLEYNSEFSEEVHHNCFTSPNGIYSVSHNFVAPDTKRMYVSYSYVDRYGWDSQTTYYNYYATDSTAVKTPIYYTDKDNLYYPLLVSADGEDYYMNETVVDKSDIFICERVFYYLDEYVKIRGYDSLQDFPAIEQTDDLFVAKDTSLVYHISNNQYVQYFTLAQMEESDRLVYRFICIICNDSLDTESTYFFSGVTYGLTDLPADKLQLGDGLKSVDGKLTADVNTYAPFPDCTIDTYNYCSDGTIHAETVAKLINVIQAFPNKAQGKAYYGEIINSNGGHCLPPELVNVEATISFNTGDPSYIAVVTLFSSNAYPYHWELNTDSSTWRPLYTLPSTKPNDFNNSTYDVKFVNGSVQYVKDEGVDSAISATSTNPVQNKVIANYLSPVLGLPSSGSNIVNFITSDGELPPTYDFVGNNYPYVITAVVDYKWHADVGGGSGRCDFGIKLTTGNFNNVMLTLDVDNDNKLILKAKTIDGSTTTLVGSVLAKWYKQNGTSRTSDTGGNINTSVGSTYSTIANISYPNGHTYIYDKHAKCVTELIIGNISYEETALTWDITPTFNGVYPPNPWQDINNRVTALENKKTTASDVDSESATSGKVLTADGSGNASWESPTSVTVDSALSTSSTNAVQNKVITDAISPLLPQIVDPSVPNVTMTTVDGNLPPCPDISPYSKHFVGNLYYSTSTSTYGNCQIGITVTENNVDTSNNFDYRIQCIEGPYGYATLVLFMKSKDGNSHTTDIETRSYWVQQNGTTVYGRYDNNDNPVATYTNKSISATYTEVGRRMYIWGATFGAGSFSYCKDVKNSDDYDVLYDTNLVEWNVNILYNGSVDLSSDWDKLNTRVTALESYHEYSETEKVVGKWIDGKDLYGCVRSTPAMNVSQLDILTDATAYLEADGTLPDGWTLANGSLTMAFSYQHQTGKLLFKETYNNQTTMTLHCTSANIAGSYSLSIYLGTTSGDNDIATIPVSIAVGDITLDLTTYVNDTIYVSLYASVGYAPQVYNGPAFDTIVVNTPNDIDTVIENRLLATGQYYSQYTKVTL